ncbi:MAG: MerR family transcriptional regulator [Dehalococcoidia bacterium]
MGDENGPLKRVGQLAKATGLTVRTLHYYEEIGLLVPSRRSDAGHRLYTAGDVERLYRICLLRRVGVPLADTARALDDPAWSLQAAMAAHLRELDRRVEAAGQLRGRVAQVLEAMGPSNRPAADALLTIVEGMTMLEGNVQRRISVLVCADIQAEFDFLVRVFGLGPGEITRSDDGTTQHGEIQCGDGVIWLHPESKEFGLASPRSTGAATAMMAIMVDDVDAHYEHAKERGATIRYEPVDQPYGYREYSALDAEGTLWSFMKPLD